jgi:hypothetical protein
MRRMTAAPVLVDAAFGVPVDPDVVVAEDRAAGDVVPPSPYGALLRASHFAIDRRYSAFISARTNPTTLSLKVPNEKAVPS